MLLSVVTWHAIAAPSTNPSVPMNLFSTNVFKVNINSLHPFPVVSVALVPVGNILSSFSSCFFRSVSFSVPAFSRFHFLPTLPGLLVLSVVPL